MSFIRDYLTYATANEAPYLFHVWGAYICLASTIGRQVCFTADDGFLYPHLYVLYVGKAGNGKGEAMRKVKRILTDAGDFARSGNVETPEGFIRFICGNPKGNPPIESTVRKLIRRSEFVVEETTPITIFATEFVNFIAMNPEGWINLLNDIWDSEADYHYRTKGQGEDVVPGPAVSMLGALTTTMAADLQKQRIIGTGLGRRTIFQFGERQWDAPVPRRIITPERLEARERAVATLQRISKIVGVMSNTPEADEWWDEWYCENLRTTPMKDFNVQSWYASKPDIVIKLAMLTALSEEASVVGLPHYTIALDYLALLEEDLPRIFGGVGRNELASVAMTIYEYISMQPMPVSKSFAKTNFFGVCKPPTDFEDCIRYLVDKGDLVEATVSMKGILDVIISTPEAMKNFAGSHAVSVLPSAVAQSALLADYLSEAGPLVARPATPETPAEVEVPTSAVSLGESLVGQLPTVQKEQG